MQRRAPPAGDSIGAVPHLPPVSRTALRVLALLLCGLGACARGAAERGDILLISVDTLRTDHMSAYGYPLATTPQLSGFFREGAIFENAYATSSYTTASMVSVLSGLLPQHHGVRLFDQLLPEDVALISWEGCTAAVVPGWDLVDGLAARVRGVGPGVAAIVGQGR